MFVQDGERIEMTSPLSGGKNRMFCGEDLDLKLLSRDGEGEGGTCSGGSHQHLLHHETSPCIQPLYTSCSTIWYSSPTSSISPTHSTLFVSQAERPPPHHLPPPSPLPPPPPPTHKYTSGDGASGCAGREDGSGGGNSCSDSSLGRRKNSVLGRRKNSVLARRKNRGGRIPQYRNLNSEHTRISPRNTHS